MRWNTSFGADALKGVLNKTMPHAIKKVQNAAFNAIEYLRVVGDMGGIKKNATGADLSWPVKFAKNPNFDWRGYEQETPQNARDGHRIASETWAEATGAVVISIKEADLNSGPEQFIDYVSEELDDGKTTMEDKVNMGLLQGSGTWPAPQGLTAIMPETNNSDTIHNISQSTKTWWRNQSTASSCSTTDAYGPICTKEVLAAAAIAGRGQGRNPFRLAVTDDTTFVNMTYYLPSLSSSIRSVIETRGGSSATLNQDMTVREPKVMLRGARVIYDHAAIADAMRFFDPGESLKIFFAKNNHFRISSPQQAEDAWVYRVLYGVLFQQMNMNPYSTFVHYNFNA